MVGACYTYISSLEEYMDAAFENSKPLLILDRPNRMFAAAAAAKVPPREQDGSSGKMRTVQFKLRIGRDAIVEIPPIVNQERPIARPLDPFEELLRDDLIRIDIRPVHRCDQAGMSGERLHGLF